MKAVLLVLTNPGSADVEDEYNQWYTGQHVPEGLQVPGYECATRYKAFPGWQPFAQNYLSLHELEVDSVDDVKRVCDEHIRFVTEGTVGRARDGVMDRANSRAMYYVALEPEQHSSTNRATESNSIFVTFNQPRTPDVADEYHRWYRDVHLPDVLSCPGFVRAQRFRRTDVTMIDQPWVRDLECVNIYHHTAETEDEYDAAFAVVRQRIASGEFVMTDTLTPGAPVAVYGRISPTLFPSR